MLAGKGKGCGVVVRVRKYSGVVILPAAVLGLLFALFMVVGQSFAESGSFDQMLATPQRVALSLVKILGYTTLFGALVTLAFTWLDRRSAVLAAHPVAPSHHAEPQPGRSCRRFWVAFLALMVCWGVFLVIFFPGSLPWDGARSLNQFLTDAPLENHHPVLMNALYGALMVLGRFLGSDNAGIFLIVLFQTVVCALVLASAFVWMEKLRAPRPLVVACSLFFLLFPLWGSFAQAAFKDTLFFGVFLWFVLRVLAVMVQPVSARRASTWILLLVAAGVVCLTRNNGIYLVLPTLVLLLAFTPRKKPLAVCALGVVCLYAGATMLLYPALGVNMHEGKEMLSIPFQQTARYAQTYPDEATEEQRQAIDAVLPYDQLGQLYNPNLSDPVKERFSGNNQALGAYFKAWFEQGLAHPGCYVQATIANTYAYFYPNVLIDNGGDRPILTFEVVGPPINTSYDVHYVMPQEVREGAVSAIEAAFDIPVLQQLYSPALYIWLLLAAAAYALHARRLDVLVLCAPCLMLVLTNIAGPLNGHLRYTLPVLATLPVILSLLCSAPLRPERPHSFDRPCPRERSGEAASSVPHEERHVGGRNLVK